MSLNCTSMLFRVISAGPLHNFCESLDILEVLPGILFCILFCGHLSFEVKLIGVF